MFAIIRALRSRGVAVLVVEQNARAALNVADRGYVLEMGRVVLDGPSADLAGDDRVARSYLGIATKSRAQAPDERRKRCATQS
jgi:branched-chain amino acid transport system ATP-binding protein